MIRLAKFTAAMLVLAGVCAAVSAGISGRAGGEAAAWAALFCIPPGWLVFLAEPMYRHPRDAVYGALIGSFVRLGLASAGLVLLVKNRPDLPRWVLAGSLVVLYLGGLLIETCTQLRAGKQGDPSAGRSSGSGQGLQSQGASQAAVQEAEASASSA